MYVKYQMADVSDSYTYMNSVMSDISDAIANTYSSTTQFNAIACDRTNSLFYGSANADIYSIITDNAAPNDGSDGTLTIRKRHHMANTSYDFYRDIEIKFTNQGTYGLRARFDDNDNLFPYTTQNAYTLTTSTNQLYDFDASKGHEINIYLSDYWIVLQFHWGNQMVTYGLMDYEITPMDYYIYDNATLGTKVYYPGVNLTSFQQDNFNEDYITTNQAQNGWNLGLQGYLTNSGAIFDYTSTQNRITDQIHANSQNDETTDVTIYPNGWRNVYEMQILGGSVHPMIPVSFHGHSNHSTDSAVISSKIPYFYRTTDNIGYPGQQITYNGTDYMNLMLHKCGGITLTDADNTRNACYLLPKLIGGL